MLCIHLHLFIEQTTHTKRSSPSRITVFGILSVNTFRLIIFSFCYREIDVTLLGSDNQMLLNILDIFHHNFLPLTFNTFL